MDLATIWVKATQNQVRGIKLLPEQENAIVTLIEMSATEPDRALEVIYSILEFKVDPFIFNCLGAGPLEELLVKHCNYINNIVLIANNNEALKQCILHVNINVEDCTDATLIHEFINRWK